MDYETRVAGVSGDNSLNFVAADKYGNCYAVGRFGGNNIVFGPVTLPNAGNGDVFIVKYDVAGNVVWAKSAGGSQNEEAYAVTTDRFGYIYVAGYFKSATITFGSNVLTNFNAGTADIFVTEYNQDGNVAWSLGAGGTGDEMAYSVAVDGMRNSFSAGYIGSATVVFGSTILTSNGTTDMFVAKTNNIPITGLGERDQKLVSIFPNPASDHISIFLNGIFSVEIYDNSGRLCKKIDEHSSPEIDISDLARGIYMIRVIKGDEILTGKFIKMNN